MALWFSSLASRGTTALLHALIPVIRGIKIQDQFAWCFPEGGNELLHHDFMDSEQGFPVSAVLQTAYGYRDEKRFTAVWIAGSLRND